MKHKETELTLIGAVHNNGGATIELSGTHVEALKTVKMKVNNYL